MSRQQKRILVTGGAGFLGSHLCDRLISDGHAVTCLDDLLSGSVGNLEHISPRDTFTFVRADVKDINFPDDQFDMIFHLACSASPKLYQARPIDTLMTCAIGTYRVLELAKQKNARVVVASASAVYGEPLEHPQRESYWGNVNPVGARSCYGEGKRFAEALGSAYWRHREQDVRIARIFNTFGPRMSGSDGRVIPNFISQALRNEPLTVYGGGQQTRSFCYVDDLIEGLMLIMFNDELAGEIFNVGSEEEITVNELANVIMQITRSSSTIHYKPLPTGDAVRRWPDTSKMREKLAWQAETPLLQGLSRTIEWKMKAEQTDRAEDIK